MRAISFFIILIPAASATLSSRRSAASTKTSIDGYRQYPRITSGCASGVYFYQLKAGSALITKKMLLVK